MSTREPEETFRRLEREMFDAYKDPVDIETIDRLYADDFLATNADGSVTNKQQVLAFLKVAGFPADRIESDDFRVRQFGDTAIITGRSEYYKDDERVGNVRHSQVWIKRDGRWQIAHWQGTPLPGDQFWSPGITEDPLAEGV